MTTGIYQEVATFEIFFNITKTYSLDKRIATFSNSSLSNGIMTEDRQLIKQIIEGDVQAFKVLIKQNERLVSHMVGRVISIQEEREEVCQDVFMKVYDKLETFNYQSKLSTWIATIAYRISLNHAKKKRIVIDMDNEELLAQKLNNITTTDTPESQVMYKDMKSYIHRLIEELPVQYQTVITLYHLEEMTYPEIAEITQMPTGTVKSYLFRGRKLLKEKLILNNQTSVS